jgi:hypothetical protein
MDGAMVLILLVTGVLGVLLGWLVPILFKSKRPLGIVGDILICTIPALIVSFVAWSWLMPALGFKPGWIMVLGSVADPLTVGLICIWLLRKLKR